MRILLLVLLMALTAGARPTLWIIGDSTVRTQSGGQMGWGDPLVAEFDPAKIEVVNRAIGGRSSRSFLNEGRWDAILANIRKGDYVLMQFGHNDGGDMFTGNRPRASIPGSGHETERGVVEQTGERETVRTYGWYLRNYCETARKAGAHPIIVSLIPRNKRDGEGRIRRSGGDYALWARQVAEQEKVPFVPFNRVLAEHYDALGKEEVDRLFATPDHTHTSPDGAAFNARVLADQLRQLDGTDLGSYLRDADCWTPHVFADHMVLQRDAPIPVWGRTRPGTSVTVSLAGNRATTTSGDDGTWSVKLPAQPAGGPFTLEVAAATTKTFTDVMIGEVWLCSGQSNMEFTVAPTERVPYAGTRDWKKELTRADVPGIRLFTAAATFREHPQPDVAGSWTLATPESVADFSAAAWFFGRDLHAELKVPVGLITCAYGGSKIEAWTSRSMLGSDDEIAPLLKNLNQRYRYFRDHPDLFLKYGEALGERKRPEHPNPYLHRHSPTVLFNGMIHPVIPYGIRGAIWYQGESNLDTRELYPRLQQALIEDWRGRWGRGDFPFYFVQLAAYKEAQPEPADSSLATMRASQAASLSLPNTGMAVTTDIGDAKDIHPRNKQDVGHRLARLALAHTYGRPFVPCGPTLKSATVESGAVHLTFDHVADGLVAKGRVLKHFALAGEDGEFHWADARIDGDEVIVRHRAIEHPAEVRYAWADNPDTANLFNSEGLPAAPFHHRF